MKDISNIFELGNDEECCYKPIALVIFIATIILNAKAMVIEMNQYQLKNILQN